MQRLRRLDTTSKMPDLEVPSALSTEANTITAEIHPRTESPSYTSCRPTFVKG